LGCQCGHPWRHEKYPKCISSLSAGFEARFRLLQSQCRLFELSTAEDRFFFVLVDKVRNRLNHRVPGEWIGRGEPILWPPRSPDLTPLDFCL
jgi:hypothetical protein